VSAFHDTVTTTFPGAMPAAAYLAEVRHRVEPLGFTPERTLPLVSICRDELTTGFFGQIEAEWGLAFTLAGLGGVPTLGRTGWQAALSHVPDAHGRGCVLVFGFPHIGIELDGTVGFTLRNGQAAPTATCGALSSIFTKWQNNDLPEQTDLDDFEATALALRLVDPQARPTTLVDLTVAALDAIEVDLWKALDGAAVTDDHDVAVWCGVQIHGHDRDDWVWPRDAWYAGADGHKRRLPGPVREPDGT
jgi:hypothetical protein